METPKPQIVSGYIRYKKEKKTSRLDTILPIVLTLSVIAMLSFVYWQIGAVVAGIMATRVSGVAVERYRLHLAAQEPHLVVHRNA